MLSWQGSCPSYMVKVPRTPTYLQVSCWCKYWNVPEISKMLGKWVNNPNVFICHLFASLHVPWFCHFYDCLRNINVRFDQWVKSPSWLVLMNFLGMLGWVNLRQFPRCYESSKRGFSFILFSISSPLASSPKKIALCQCLGFHQNTKNHNQSKQTLDTVV